MAGSDGVYGTLDNSLRILAGSPCVDAADGNTALSSDMLGIGRLDVNDGRLE